jgi:hypothetical protein
MFMSYIYEYESILVILIDVILLINMKSQKSLTG